MKIKKLFKQKTKEVAVMENPEEQQELINLDVELYKDVFFAQDRILKEAEAILNSADSEKTERLIALHNLGFCNAAEVENSHNEKYKTEMYHRIKYYKETYPLHKFIDYNTVDAVCEKYNLYLGDVYYFKGEIPVQNQKEIVAFRIKGKDILKDVYSGDVLSEYFGEDLMPAKGLKIIAPEKDFDMRYLEKRNRTLVMKDPIVLQEVDYGYLIVSSWGLEAGDAMVTNEINN